MVCRRASSGDCVWAVVIARPAFALVSVWLQVFSRGGLRRFPACFCVGLCADIEWLGCNLSRFLGD